jgi:hypothetical protein
MLRQGRRGAGYNAIDRGHPAKFRAYGMALWQRADKGITLNGSTVSAYADQSGAGGTNVAQASAGQQPTYNAANAAFNGRPTIDPDGVDDVILGAGFLNGATFPKTHFMVCASAAAGGTIAAWEPSPWELRLRMNGANTVQMLAPASGVNLTVANLAAAQIFTCVWNGASSSLQAGGGTPATGTATNKTWAAVELGGLGPGFQVAASQQAENLVFVGTLIPEPIKRRIRNRLGALYGVAA